jgi:hypothetical protein
VALLLLGGGLVGCAAGDAKDVVVAWRLIDGRSCVDTAVVQVTIDLDGGTTASGICHSQPTANRIAISGVRPGATLHAKALSGRQAVLYRAELTVADPVASLLDLALYYTGGQ